MPRYNDGMHRLVINLPPLLQPKLLQFASIFNNKKQLLSSQKSDIILESQASL